MPEIKRRLQTIGSTRDRNPNSNTGRKALFSYHDTCSDCGSLLRETDRDRVFICRGKCGVVTDPIPPSEVMGE